MFKKGLFLILFCVLSIVMQTQSYSQSVWGNLERDVLDILVSFNYEQGTIDTVIDRENATITFYHGGAAVAVASLVPDIGLVTSYFKDFGLFGTDWDSYMAWFKEDAQIDLKTLLDRDENGILTEDEAQDFGALYKFLTERGTGGSGPSGAVTDEDIITEYANHTFVREQITIYDEKTGLRAMSFTYSPDYMQADHDGIDNDRDGKIDAEDTDGEVFTVFAMEDGIDNDGDGLIDDADIDGETFEGGAASKALWDPKAGFVNGKRADVTLNASASGKERVENVARWTANVVDGEATYILQTATFFDDDGNGINEKAEGTAALLGATFLRDVFADIGGQDPSRALVVVTFDNTTGQMIDVFAVQTKMNKDTGIVEPVIDSKGRYVKGARIGHVVNDIKGRVIREEGISGNKVVAFKVTEYDAFDMPIKATTFKNVTQKGEDGRNIIVAVKVKEQINTYVRSEVYNRLLWTDTVTNTWNEDGSFLEFTYETTRAVFGRDLFTYTNNKVSKAEYDAMTQPEKDALIAIGLKYTPS